MKLIQDITPVKEICKWCRKPIQGTGLEHAVCSITWHRWVHEDHYAPQTITHIEIIDEAEQIERNLRKKRPELTPVLDQLKEHARYFSMSVGTSTTKPSKDRYFS